MRTKSIEYYIVDSELRSLFNGFVEAHDWAGGQKPDDFRVYFDNNEDTGVIEFLLDSEWVEELGIEQDFNDYIHHETNHSSVFDLTTNKTCTIEYPDRIGMGFNHNYISIIQGVFNEAISHFTVTVHNDVGTTKTIKVVPHKNRTDILLDEAIRAIAFEEYTLNQTLWEFDYTINAVQTNGEQTILLSDYSHFLHGYLKPGQRLHNLGAANREPYIKKILVFEGFENVFSIPLIEATHSKPYMMITSATEPLADIVSIFQYNNPRNNECVQIVTIGQGGVEESYYIFKKAPDMASGSFTEEFNDPFQPPTPDDLVFYLIPVKRKDGVFLRWIDNMGLWHSFLFENGTEENDVTPDSNVLEEHHNTFGIMQTLKRPISVESKTTITCGAPCLDDILYEDVSSIAEAQYVEMYINGGYIPVIVSSTNIKKNVSKLQNTVEVKIVLRENSYTI